MVFRSDRTPQWSQKRVLWNSNEGLSHDLITVSAPFPSLPFETSLTGLSDAGSCISARRGFGREPDAGRRVGPFRLLERLGRGGQADVWRALRLEPTMMEVALKLIPERGQDPRRIAQLRREAERGLRLCNAGPGLVRAFAFGEADGHWFMAMPLVRGTTLAAILSGRRAYVLGRDPSDIADHILATLPEPEYVVAVLRLVGRVARSLADAHAARIVHRDIKPQNILVPKNHREGAFLCDFGLGRDLDVATPEQLLDGAGSPHYMAPERLLKSTGCEYRGEIFSLGATLYESLTLTLPVTIPNNLPRSAWPEFLAKNEPIPPSQLRPGLDRRIEEVVMKALARNPAHRHPSASMLATELESLARVLQNQTRASV